ALGATLAKQGEHESREPDQTSPRVCEQTRRHRLSSLIDRVDSSIVQKKGDWVKGMSWTTGTYLLHWQTIPSRRHSGPRRVRAEKIDAQLTMQLQHKRVLVAVGSADTPAADDAGIQSCLADVFGVFLPTGSATMS